eukprot:scaffold33831_cov111-Cyclotella_meneghiniana.AAC.2
MVGRPTPSFHTKIDSHQDYHPLSAVFLLFFLLRVPFGLVSLVIPEVKDVVRWVKVKVVTAKAQ